MYTKNKRNFRVITGKKYKKKKRRKSKKKQKALGGWLLILSSVIISMSLFISRYNLEKQYNLYVQTENSYTQLYEKEKEREKELEVFKKEVNTPVYTQKIAREKLGLVYKNEIIYKEK